MDSFRIVEPPRERIKKALDEMGMKPIELAEKSGIAKSTISRYLSGKYEPKNAAVYKMAQVLHVDERWLMGYDVPPRPADTPSPDERILAAYHAADPIYQQIVLELLESHPKKSEEIK